MSQLSATNSILATAISALSNIEFHAKQGIPEDAFMQATSSVKKHVKMLDGLALLLIIQQKSECAATALVEETGPKPEDKIIKILWAKNDPKALTAKQQKYLDKLIESFKRLDAPDQTLLLVVDACRAKIIQRCQKVFKLFEKQSEQSPDNVFKISQTEGIYEPLQEKLRGLKVIQQKTTLRQSLNYFIKCLNSVNANTPSKLVVWALVYAYRITEGAQSICKVIDQYQCHRIRKLADYR